MIHLEKIMQCFLKIHKIYSLDKVLSSIFFTLELKSLVKFKITVAFLHLGIKSPQFCKLLYS